MGEIVYIVPEQTVASLTLIVGSGIVNTDTKLLSEQPVRVLVPINVKFVFAVGLIVIMLAFDPVFHE